MSRTKLTARAFCLILLAHCIGSPDSSRAEAPPPQDSLWNQQWNMKNTGQWGGTAGIDVGLLGAWDFTTGSDQVKVAVISAAAYAAHPDFIPAVGGSRIETHGDYSPGGTLVAGIIAAEANNGGAVKRGIAGMDQACTVLSYDEHSSDNINAAVSAGTRVIEFFNVFEDPDVAAQGKSLAQAYKHDVVLVAPTGNDSGQHWYYPASFDGVIGVGGVLNDGQHALRHSTTGASVDLVGPDGDTNLTSDRWLTSLIPVNGYAKVQATQYACAHVAGAASLLRAAHPELSNDDIANVLQLSARDVDVAGRDDRTGYGLVKIDSALRILQSPNTLRHLTVTSTPSIYSVSSRYWCTFYDVEGRVA